MATDLNDLVDLDRFAEMHDEKFTSIDAKCDIKLWDYVKGNFRTKHLFRTNNHPSGVLMAYTLHRILAASPLGEWIQNSGTVLESTAASFGIGAFEDPIHPQVIDHFSLNYLGKDYKYKYRFEGAFDFESRLRRYLRFDYNEHALSLTSAVHAGNIEKIREHALDAIVRQPDSWYVYYCLATVFQNLGRREDELRSLLIAKRFANGQWAVHQRLAQHYRKYGMRAQALEEQETALRLEPYRGAVHFQYGLILADANERERAGAAFARAYELEPNNPKIAARRPAPLPASGVRQEDL